MKPALIHWLVLWLLALAMGRAAPLDVRFSHTLNAEERATAGLNRLSSDEVAVVDALVRRDTVSRAGQTTNANADTPDAFSQRLTADERRTAGMPKLSAEELARVDGFVARFQAAKLARTLLAPPVYLSRQSRVTPTEAKKEREIHGAFSLSYGFGSGGYSEKTGSMMLTMDDPARRFSITIGYTESHIKGGHVYGDPWYDPFYDRGRYYGPDLLGDPFYDRGRFYDRDPFLRPVRDLPEGVVIERR